MKFGNGILWLWEINWKKGEEVGQSYLEAETIVTEEGGLGS
jgi:hypothetical protein